MPATILLSALCNAGVLERASARQGPYLRVTPRFLAHAEETGARLRLQGRPSDPASTLASALFGWDDYAQDPHQGALVLADLLGQRDQLGLLRPVFPVLEQFAQVAA